MYGQKVRVWTCTARGAGFVLVHRDGFGFQHVVQPTDEEDGDGLDDCRWYFGNHGQPLDVFVEPDGTRYVMSRSVTEDVPAPTEKTPKPEGPWIMRKGDA